MSTNHLEEKIKNAQARISELVLLISEWEKSLEIKKSR